MIRVQDQVYELIEENKDGFIQETFKERYSDILTKFDYIVGDWGYGQLRLKGFYEDTNRKAPFDSRISFLDEYIMEYCNFGCPYFLLKKVKQATRIDDVEAAELIDQDEQPRVEKGEEKPARNKDGKRRDKRRSRSRRGKPKESKEQKETKEKQPIHTE
ncbi:YutD family protein [Aneurinibacillus sp. BA2021]|nr:YutD family protein [Aneurinibacillus sp. BA2021]